MGVVAVTIVVMFWRYVQKWNVKFVGRWILGCAVLGITSLLLFPVAYASVRYLPTVIGHPDYLDSESNRLYSFNTRVLNQKFLYNGEYTPYSIKVGDPADSVKYISFSESLVDVLGRIIPGINHLIPMSVYEDAFTNKLERMDYYLENNWISEKGRKNLLNSFSNLYFNFSYIDDSEEAVHERTTKEITVKVDTAEDREIEKKESSIEAEPTEKTKVLRGDTEETMWFPEGTIYNAWDVRNAIHSFAIQHLNWNGHELFDFKMYLAPEQIIGHAHNIFLIIGYDYGIGVMLMMAFFFGAIVVLSVRKWKKTGQVMYLFPLCLVIGMCVFGIWESGFRCDNAFSIFIFITTACLGKEQKRTVTD